MPQGRRFAPLDAAGLILIGAAYFVVAYLGLQLASINPSATPIWPATGLAIAATLAWGYRVAPAIFVAAFFVNYVTAGSAMTAAAIGLGNTLEAVATAYLVMLWAGGVHVFDTPAGVGKFALISAATTTISATTGVGSLAITGYAEAGKVGAIWLTWWLGDLAGAVVITPMVLLWIVPQATRPSFGETALVYGAATAIGMVAFSPLLPQTGLRDPLGFLAVGPLFWAALRCGPRDTATVAASWHRSPCGHAHARWSLRASEPEPILSLASDVLNQHSHSLARPECRHQRSPTRTRAAAAFTARAEPSGGQQLGGA